MKRRPELEALIERHRLLDRLIEDQRTHFLSDWNCDNPFANELLGPQLSELAPTLSSSRGYIYFDEEQTVLREICLFHLIYERLQLSQANVVAGPGSSSFLAAFSLWLLRCGYTDIYYLPPLYHTFHFLLEAVDINVTPASVNQSFEADYTMNLPNHHTVLLMCDPVWYAGKSVPQKHIEMIADWQRATRSLVFVDGSFQYMKWNRIKGESTSLLDPELTFRLVCPTKALAIPHFRFAYLLHPAEAHHDLLFIYESIVGGASASDLAFAKRALQILKSDSTGYIMTDFFGEIFSDLVRRDLIRTGITPDCSYFTFAVPLVKPENLLVMDGSYFELKGYDHYCRINLMAARRIYRGLVRSSKLESSKSMSNMRPTRECCRKYLIPMLLHKPTPSGVNALAQILLA